MSRRYLNRIPKPPLLTSFNGKGQRFYSKVLPNVWSPHPVAKCELTQPEKKRLWPPVSMISFCQFPKFMTIGEGWNVDCTVNQDLHQFSTASVDRMLHPSLVNKTQSYLNSFTWGALTHSQPEGSNPPLSSRVSWSQTWKCRFSSPPFHNLL